MISKSQIKLIKSLHLKKNRIAHKLFLVEGLKSIIELIKSDYKIYNIIATKSVVKKQEMLFSKSKIDYTTSKILSTMGNFKTNTSAIAVVELKDTSKKIINRSNYSIVLDGINDPGNLGSIIRIADWYGIENIICSMESVDLYNPKVIQSSMGSFTRVNVYYRNLEDFFKQNSTCVYGAVLGEKDYHKEKFNKRGILFFGNESNGISPNLNKFIDRKISIFGKGKAESLNVAISSALVLDKVRNFIN